MMTSRVLRAAFIATFPVLLGYVTIGMAFGLLLIKSGYPWFLATFMSTVLYAGAAQFLAIGLFVSGASVVEAAAITLALNARHLVYGLSLLTKFRGTRGARPYLIFSLTDETYALLASVKVPDGENPSQFYTLVSALNQAYWVVGCTMGALVGGAVSFDTRGLDFALTALFVVLLIEQTKTMRSPVPYLVAAIWAVVAMIVASENILIVAIVGTLCTLLPAKRLMKHANAL